MLTSDVSTSILETPTKTQLGFQSHVGSPLQRVTTLPHTRRRPRVPGRGLKLWQRRYFPNMQASVLHDIGVTSLIAVLQTFWVLTWQLAASANFVPSSVSRKILHISCGPLFMIFWPLYSDEWFARWLCASVPTFALIRLVLAANETIRDGIAKVRPAFHTTHWVML